MKERPIKKRPSPHYPPLPPYPSMVSSPSHTNCRTLLFSASLFVLVTRAFSLLRRTRPSLLPSSGDERLLPPMMPPTPWLPLQSRRPHGCRLRYCLSSQLCPPPSTKSCPSLRLSPAALLAVPAACPPPSHAYPPPTCLGEVTPLRLAHKCAQASA